MMDDLQSFEDSGERAFTDPYGLRVLARVRWQPNAAGGYKVWVRYYGKDQKVYWSIEAQPAPRATFQFPAGNSEGTIELAGDGPSIVLRGDLPLDPGSRFQGEIARWRPRAESAAAGEPAWLLPAEAPGGLLAAAVEGCGEPPCGLQPLAWRRGGTVIENPLLPQELFRCLWVRASGELSPEAIGLDFVFLDDPARLPFYVELAELKGQPDGRLKMMQAACSFAGSPDYVRGLDQLGTPVSAYAELAAILRGIEGEVPIETLLEAVDTFLFAYGVGPLAAYLESPYFAETEARVWSSLFAVALGAVALPWQGSALTEVLRIDHFLVELARELAAPPPQPLCDPGVRAAVLAATVVLPEGAVPEDPSCTCAPPPFPDGWVKVIGVGDLRLVFQCLKGYRPGEVAAVVNVMERERLEASARELERIRESEESRRSDVTEQDEASEALSRSDLKSELADVIAAEALCSDYDNLQQTYSATAITLNGTWSGNDCFKERADREAQRYVQGLTRRAATRLGHTVAERRTRQRLWQHETLQSRDIDNRQGAERLVGIYRWLQKLYELTLKEAGKRLVAEFLIADPAADYLRSIRTAGGIRLTRPKRLSEENVFGPSDVTPENYRYLASLYQLEGLAPPPAEQVILVRSFQAQPPAASADLAVPENYEVASGTVSYLLDDGEASLVGYAGPQAFSYSPPPAPPPAALTVLQTAAGGGSGCPQCQDPFAYTPPALKPVQGSEPLAAVVGWQGPLPVNVLSTAPSFQVTVTLICDLVSASGLLQAWQVRTYDALVAGYQRCLEEYERQLAARIAADSAGDKRRIERRELKRRALAILLSRRSFSPCAPPAVCPGLEERYLEYFRRAFEWREMTYAFHRRPVREEPCGPEPFWPGQAILDLEADELFARFLRAGSARVLVPVRPGYELGILYYLHFGLLWPSGAGSIPVAAADVPLVIDLGEPAEGPECGPSWQVEIPTSLLYLQEGGDLPVFECPPECPPSAAAAVLKGEA